MHRNPAHHLDWETWRSRDALRGRGLQPSDERRPMIRPAQSAFAAIADSSDPFPILAVRFPGWPAPVRAATSMEVRQTPGCRPETARSHPFGSGAPPYDAHHRRRADSPTRVASVAAAPLPVQPAPHGGPSVDAPNDRVKSRETFRSWSFPPTDTEGLQTNAVPGPGFEHGHS